LLAIVCVISFNSFAAAEPGQLEWEFTTGGGVDSSPAVSGGYVYVGSSDNKLYCLNAATGAKEWEFTTGGGVDSSPAVSDGYVYVGSHDGKVYCLNAATGAKEWEFIAGGSVESSPAVSDGYVYVGSHDGKVYCLNAATGAKEWEFTTGRNVESSPAVSDGYVYVGSHDVKVYCLNAATGAKEWEFTTGGNVESSPAVSDGYVYVGSWNGKVYCLNAATGAKEWEYTIGNIVDSSPAVSEGYVYVFSPKSKVSCLNAATGAKEWEFITPHSPSSLAVSGGYVYVGFLSGEVYCLNAATGAKEWEFTIGGHVYSYPAVSGGYVYVGSSDNKLYCLNAAEGDSGSWPMFRQNNARTGVAATCTIDTDCTSGYCVDNFCVECIDNSHCTDGGQYCTSVPICTDGVCGVGDPCEGITPVCDEFNDRCVECLEDGQCDIEYACEDGSCVLSGSIIINKCKIKAGKDNRDSITLSGSFDATQADFNNAIGDDLIISIKAEHIPNPSLTRASFPIRAAYIKKGQFKPPKTYTNNKTDPVAKCSFNTNTGKLKCSAKNINFTGLACPITVRIQLGDYLAEAIMYEDIVNGPKKLCPPELMER